MTTQHPEALRLAEELDDGYPLTGDAISAAAELRTQHARITELEAQLEAIGAGGVSPLMAGIDHWVSVDERLPAPDEPVLACNGKWIGVAAWMSGEYLEPLERWQDEHREFIEMMGPAITHWMPLPAPPSSAQREVSQ